MIEARTSIDNCNRKSIFFCKKLTVTDKLIIIPLTDYLWWLDEKNSIIFVVVCKITKLVWRGKRHEIVEQINNFYISRES